MPQARRPMQLWTLAALLICGCSDISVIRVDNLPDEGEMLELTVGLDGEAAELPCALSEQGGQGSCPPFTLSLTTPERQTLIRKNHRLEIALQPDQGRLAVSARVLGRRGAEGGSVCLLAWGSLVGSTITMKPLEPQCWPSARQIFDVQPSLISAGTLITLSGWGFKRTPTALPTVDLVNDDRNLTLVQPTQGVSWLSEGQLLARVPDLNVSQWKLRVKVTTPDGASADFGPVTYYGQLPSGQCCTADQRCFTRESSHCGEQCTDCGDQSDRCSDQNRCQCGDQPPCMSNQRCFNDGKSSSCVTCDTNSACGPSCKDCTPGGQVCDGSKCVDCTMDDDCAARGGGNCKAGTCRRCKEDSECLGQGCDPTGTCKPCPTMGPLDPSTVFVPGGSVTIGASTVHVPDFKLDTFLVTVGAYRKAMLAHPGKLTPPYTMDSDGKPYCNWTASAGDVENQPLNCVSWDQANKYCNALGGFLPTEKQWLRAAAAVAMPGASRYLKYPWGDSYASRQPGELCGRSESTTPCPWNRTPLIRRLQGRQTCFGAADLVGNLYEWMNATYLEPYDPAKETPCNGVGLCAMRGGAYSSSGCGAGNLLEDCYAISNHYKGTKDQRYSGWGFRCVY